MGAARRIAVDLNPLLPDGENGGAATATVNLLAEFAARGRELLLFVFEDNASIVDHLLGPGVERYVVRRHSVAHRTDRTSRPWPRPWSLSHALGADVLYCPFGDPFWAEEGVPTVCTINDLQHFDHPEFFGAEEITHRGNYLGRLVRLADTIVVPTEFTRRSVETHLRPAVPIEVVGYPAARRWIGVDADARDGRVHVPDRRFLLYPANAWPHKNHARLFEALAVHRDRAVAGGRTPIRLLCTGSPLGSRAALDQQIAELRLAGTAEVLGHVSDAQLRGLYQRASGLIFPSLYEGFGLPVLEAMALSVPVACSNRTALPEVASDAALLFDPLDPLAIADAIDVLAGDDAATRELVARGERRARCFDADRAVNALLGVFDDLVSTSAPGSPPASVGRPSVSVVMPSYQQAEFIGRAIDSVAAQGDAVSEFVVCDGGSTDGTVAILEANRHRLDYVSEPDEGQAAAVNKAIAKVSGDVIAWLNSDDVWYPGALDAAATVFAHHPDLEWVYFAADHIGPDDEVLEPYYDRPWDPAVFRDQCFICQPAAFIRSRFVHEVGDLDESLRYCMDYELWFRMSRVSAPVYVPVVTAGSRLHPATKTLGQRAAVLEETVGMLARVHGRTSQWWLLGQIGELVNSRRDWDESDPAESRKRHRVAVALAAQTFLRHRSMPEPATRAILLSWVKAAVGAQPIDPRVPRPPAGARLGGRLTPKARARIGRPYHAASRWIRRRTIWELEPRLHEIEKGVQVGHRAIETLHQELTEHGERLARIRPTELQLERLVFHHHQVEEALVDRLTAEMAELRQELADLRTRLDDDA